MKTVKKIEIIFLTSMSLLLIACQSHRMSNIGSNLVINNDKRQILVTFSQSASDNWLPGGSTKSYHGGGSWSAPLILQRKISRLEKKFDLTKSTVWPIEFLDVYCVVFNIDTNVDVEELMNSIQEDDDVVEVQTMNEFSVMANTEDKLRVYNDPQFDLQYGNHVRSIEKLHSISRGKKIRIGIIDTPVDVTHQDLFGQVTAAYHYVPFDNTKIASAHGTAIAGIISAKANNHQGLVGLAPEASLYVYGACYRNDNRSARCNSLTLLQALEQAIKDKVNVLNLSLAGPYDPLLEKLLKVALQQKIIIVAAKSESTSLNFPASMTGVYGVSSQSMSPTNPAVLADDYETFDSWIMKEEKLSTQSGGGYQFFYGSSVTSASVSGLVALLKAKLPDEDIDLVLQRFTNYQCTFTEGLPVSEWVNNNSIKCDEIYIKLLKNEFQLLTKREND